MQILLGIYSSLQNYLYLLMFSTNLYGFCLMDKYKVLHNCEVGGTLFWCIFKNKDIKSMAWIWCDLTTCLEPCGLHGSTIFPLLHSEIVECTTDNFSVELCSSSVISRGFWTASLILTGLCFSHFICGWGIEPCSVWCSKRGIFLMTELL